MAEAIVLFSLALAVVFIWAAAIWCGVSLFREWRTYYRRNK